MFESAIVFAFSLVFGLTLYKTYTDLKSSKQMKAYSKMAKPIYDFKGRLLRHYFYWNICQAIKIKSIPFKYV